MKQFDRSHHNCGEYASTTKQSALTCHAEFISASHDSEILKQVQDDIKVRAFTLAEVLITLTIIGVIAALTIPNLMQSYKKHQVEAQLKEAYSILNNALTMAKAQNGGFDEMIDTANGSASVFAENFVKPYVKYSEYCADTSCNIFKYNKGSQRNDRLYGVDGSVQNNGYGSYGSWAKFKLNNGMFLGVKYDYVYAPSYLFIVDINGHKGKNQIGYDIFYFQLFKSNTGDGCPNSSYCNRGTRIFPGRSTYECHLDKTHSCSLGACSVDGLACAVPIFYNGWRIPDNYPVKKF